MKVAVLNNCVPFLRGGAEHLAEALTVKLREYGHQAMLVRIPFRWDPPEKIIKQMLACRAMRLPNTDLAIGLKFPAYYIPHPNKVLWLLHQFRQAYDFWGTEFQGLPDSTAGREVRAAVIQADNSYLSEARHIYTNSEVTGDRLRRFNGIESTVLLPPLLHSSTFFNKEYGDFIFCPSRVNSTKRQHLLVEAMKHCRTGVRLVIAGQPEAEPDARRIWDTIEAEALSDRVTFLDRFIPEEEKIELFSRSLGCAYLPYDEDSYGYVTLEACLSRKAVITCNDSGGISTLVRNGETGLIVPPAAETLAEAMDSLFDDKARAGRMGAAGYELAQSLEINWDRVIRTLAK